MQYRRLTMKRRAALKPAERKMLMEAMKAVKFDWEDNPSFSQSPRGGGGDFWQWIEKDFDEFADQLDDQLKSSFPQLESDEAGYTDLASMPKREYLYLATKMASQRKTTKKATERQRLIRLASTLEKGSPERKAILSGLRLASTKTAKKRKAARDEPIDIYPPARSASLQSKGLKAIKVASDSIPLWIPVQGRPKEVMPANNTDFKLREVQKLVGGYVEVVYLRDGRIMLVDEEGLLKGAPLNRAASRMAGRPIVGNVVVMPNDMFR